MAHEPIISARGVTKSFGQVSVLKGVDFDVMPSKVSVVIGPSGSGKSTLLRCCNGLEPPARHDPDLWTARSTAARILAGPGGAQNLRDQVGMVFQRSTCFRISPLWATSRSLRAASGPVGFGRGRVGDGAARRVGLADKRDAHPARCRAGSSNARRSHGARDGTARDALRRGDLRAGSRIGWRGAAVMKDRRPRHDDDGRHPRDGLSRARLPIRSR